MGSPCLDLQIGTTAANRRNLRYYSIPDPDEWTYGPYSSVRQSGDGQLKGFGFITFSWTWNTLSQAQVNTLLGFFTATEASVTVHVQTYTDAGGGPQTTTVGTAIMDRPIDGDSKAMISETRRPTYNNVVLNFRHYVAT